MGEIAQLPLVYGREKIGRIPMALAWLPMEDQDLLPRLLLPLQLPLLQLLLGQGAMFAQSPAKNAVELAKTGESLVNVDASKIELGA